MKIRKNIRNNFGTIWSLSDGVCIAKAVAREIKKELK